MKIIGLDVGEKRIGIAQADSATKIAVPTGYILADGPRRFNGDSYAVSNALPERTPSSSSHQCRSSVPDAPSMSSMRLLASDGIDQKSARIAASTALVLASDCRSLSPSIMVKLS